MLHLRRQLDSGAAAGVGQTRSRVRCRAPSGQIGVAGLGAWGANRG